MDFFKLIQSLDELIYEVVSWLLFYPLTLWRMISAPLQTMAAAESEISDPDKGEFTQLVSPPLFLLLTLILVHALELGTVGQNELVTSSAGLSRFISDDTSLIIFRTLMYSALPLFAAMRLVRSRRARLDKQELRGPFYAQSYAAACFALLADAAPLAAYQFHWFGAGLQLAVFGVSLIWLLSVEARWFAAKLNVSIGRGLGEAALMVGQWLLGVLILVFLLA